MKCPECGQWNRASFPTCQRCGAPLTPPAGEDPAWKGTLHDDRRGKSYIRVDQDGQADSVPDERDALAGEMAELKKRKEAGRRQQRKMQEESLRREETPSGATVRTHTTADSFWEMAEDRGRSVRVVREGGPGGSAAETEDPYATGRTHRVSSDAEDGSRSARGYEPLWSDQEMSATWRLPTSSTAHLTRRLPSRARGLRHVVRFLTVVLILGVLGLGAYFGINYLKEKQDTVKEASKAVVTASIKDDLAAHTILIPGEDGTQIYIRELHTSYIVTGGFATVEVADHTWYDNYEDFLDETMEVTLTPFIKTASGQQKPMDPITYEISIPLSPIELLTPDTTRFEVSAAMYTMKFAVRPGSTVTINGESYSDTVNSETGEFSYNATVQPIGDNNFTIVCRSQYCRENTMTVVLYRAPQEVPLDLAADTYSTTNKATMQVSCNTVPGAVVEVESPYSDLDITNVDATGAFTFYAIFDHIGYNTITITASIEGKKTSTVNYDVYYLPSAAEYTPKAWKLDTAGYAELLSNITVRAAKTQIYVAMGTIQYFVSEKPQMAVINTSDDGQSQPVLLQNYTKTTWKVGQYYRIYADAYGTYNGMPWLNARYTYSDPQ